MAKLYIVCGHGQGDPGAGGYGYNEAERVRTLAAEMVRQGGSDVILGNPNINWYANKTFNTLKDPGCPIIELHMDSNGASAKGGHVIIKAGFSPDQYDTALANYIRSVFPGRANNPNGRSDLQNVNICARRGLNYRLLETCFISNKGDLDYFNSHIPEIAKGILGAFGINGKDDDMTPEQSAKLDFIYDHMNWDDSHFSGTGNLVAEFPITSNSGQTMSLKERILFNNYAANDIKAEINDLKAEIDEIKGMIKDLAK